MLRSILFGVATVGLAGALFAQGPIPTPIAKGNVSIELAPVATGLAAPNLLISAPDGTNRQFIVDQPGQVWLLQNGVMQSTPFLDTSSRLTPLTPGYDERGLLGLAFDPGFANPVSPGFRRVFTYTSEPVAGTADLPDPYITTTLNHHSVVASWRVNPANPNVVDPATRQEILRIDQPQSNHNGGRIDFGPDNFLYIALGDGGGANDNNANGHNPTIGNGQDPTIALGKVLRIDVNGTNSRTGATAFPATIHSRPAAVSGRFTRAVFATRIDSVSTAPICSSPTSGRTISRNSIS